MLVYHWIIPSLICQRVPSGQVFFQPNKKNMQKALWSVGHRSYGHHILWCCGAAMHLDGTRTSLLQSQPLKPSIWSIVAVDGHWANPLKSIFVCWGRSKVSIEHCSNLSSLFKNAEARIPIVVASSEKSLAMRTATAINAHQPWTPSLIKRYHLCHVIMFYYLTWLTLDTRCDQ
jgi:hypothetical protein